MRNPITAEVHNFSADAAPTASNDATEGYRPGAQWIDQTNEDAYTCIDNSVGAAVWLSQRNGSLVGG